MVSKYPVKIKNAGSCKKEKIYKIEDVGEKQMIIKNEDRIKTIRPNLKDGQGHINIFDLTTKKTIPKSLRLCSEFVLQSGESIGSHAHIGETEIYYIISGEGSILDDGEFRKIYHGDTAITDGEKPHSIKNDGNEELRFIGIIVLD